MLKLEEIQTPDFFTGFLICQSLLTHSTYYLQTIENFFIIKVFKFNLLDDQKKLLSKNVSQEHVVFTLNLGEQQIISNFHLIQCGICISTLENRVLVVELTAEDTY